MALPASLGGTGRLLSRARFLFLFEAAFQMEVIGALTRPPWAPSLSAKFTRCNSTCLASDAIMRTHNEKVVVQKAIAVFKNGELSLTWECPFCADHNQLSFSNMPPFVEFRGPIPCFCHGCQNKYAITVRQKLTGVVISEMKQ